jgi:pyridoxal/pyridoxine/pyridoxamine kinase
MGLSNEQKKPILEKAIELLPKQYLMCSAITEAAVLCGIPKEDAKDAFKVIPELMLYMPEVKVTKHIWFHTDTEGYNKRINILTEIYNQL